MELKGLKINFLGDSITEGVGISDINDSYWKRFEADGCLVRGYGVSGTRIAEQNTPSVNEPTFDESFNTRAKIMDTDADVVVVFGGTNDYGHGDAALGDMQSRDPHTFYGALHTLYAGLYEKYPTAQIVVMTPCQRNSNDEPYNDWGVRRSGKLIDYVDIIREVAAYYSIPVLDLYRTLGIFPHTADQCAHFMPDGLHPNAAGHERIYKRLKGFLQTL